jgi:putative ABC transport system substrate-binding protein
VRRRDLLILAASTAIAWPLAARAQQKAMPVIGYLSGRSLGDNDSFVAAFRQGLGEVGFVEGQNLAIEYRWAEGHYDRYPALAADLAGRKVDVITTVGGVTAALAVKATTATIPIVFLSGTDPVAAGLVANLARPGGNLTGVSIQLDELMPKRLDLLSELVPRARVFALLVNPARASELSPSGMQEAARTKGVQLPIVKASTADEIDAAFDTLVNLHADALIVGSDPFFPNRREQIVALASRYAVPAIFPDREFTASGGLISYAPSFAAALRLVGTYVGRILKGVKPADLPVQQPDKFELVINLKTAKALGLTVPQSLLARADEVIE